MHNHFSAVSLLYTCAMQLTYSSVCCHRSCSLSRVSKWAFISLNRSWPSKLLLMSPILFMVPVWSLVLWYFAPVSQHYNWFSYFIKSFESLSLFYIATIIVDLLMLKFYTKHYLMQHCFLIICTWCDMVIPNHFYILDLSLAASFHQCLNFVWTATQPYIGEGLEPDKLTYGNHQD